MVKKKAYVLKKNVLIGDILRDCPRIAEYFVEYGLSCVTCILNQFETLEAGAKTHNMSGKALQKMIDEINEQLKKEV